MKLGRLSWRWAAIRNGFQDATAYRIEFLFEILGSALVPAAIQIVLLYAVFKIGGANEVNGLTYVDMIHYAMATVLFSQVRGGDHDFELQEMIRTGQLSNYLLRPVGVVEFVYIRGAAPRLFIAGVALLVGIVASFWTGWDPVRMIGAMFLAFLGNIIHYQIGAMLSTTAFLWEEAYSILMVKNMIVGILSGEMIHLGWFPDQWAWIWKSTPFYLYVYGPAQYALGKWTHAEYFMNLGIAGLWLIAAGIGIRVAWWLGMRRYLSLGG